MAISLDTFNGYDKIKDLALKEVIRIIFEQLQTLDATESVAGQYGTLSVGGAATESTALVELISTTKGFLPPVQTTAQRDAISSPAAGLVIYNSTTNKLNFYNGSAWEAVTSA